MGSSQTKERSPSEKVVEGLKEKVRLLQGEMKEVMCIREREREIYEREMMVFAFKQAEWKRERKRLKEEARKLLEDHKQQGDFIMPCCNTRELDRDETLEKWKQLYFAIKLELDHLIQRTRQEERLCWKTTEAEEDVMLEIKQELTAKEERIEFLQAKLAAMEHHELKREREMDILRQSLRIMSHKKRPTKLHRRPLPQY